MRIPRIYTEQTLSAGSEVELEESSSHHLLKVLRMSEGRELILFNGSGGEYAATISMAGKKVARVRLGDFSQDDRESPLITELAIGISKGDRFDWVLQKATELGVTKITPLFSERTEVKLQGERLQKRIGQWQKIIVGACEQCQRNRLPVLETPQALEAFLVNCTSEQKFVLHHRADAQLRDISKPSSVALMIGPEGGLSDAEISAAENSGFISLTLGPRVLRTETAPITALTLVQSLWGDLL